MVRAAAVLLSILVSTSAVAGPVDAADKTAFRTLIDGQIAAFRAGNARAAFEVVDPDLKLKFGDAERFLEVVRVGYRPVYAPKSYRFGHTIELEGPNEAGQWLHVVGPNNEPVDALYLLERQPSGEWKTSGCLLFRPERPST